jgi:hypothetical protein
MAGCISKTELLDFLWSMRQSNSFDAADEKTGQGGGKDVARKSPKTDFPSQLANPANYAGFALPHRLYD